MLFFDFPIVFVKFPDYFVGQQRIAERLNFFIRLL
jgi:hypothetical protein